MRKINLAVSTLALLVLAALFVNAAISSTEPAAGQKQYDLKYSMEKDTTFTINSKGSSNIVTDQMGTEITADIESTGKNIFKVLAADKAKGLTIEIEFGEGTQEMISNMGSGETDFTPLVGKKAKFMLHADGEVDGHEGFGVLPEIYTVTQETLNKDLYELGMEATFFKLPEKPVKLGDTWTDTDTTDIPVGEFTLKIEEETTYKVMEEVKKEGYDCLKIESAGVARTTGDFEQNGTPLSIERETKTKSTIYFAYKLGMYISIEGESNAEGVITIQGAGMEGTEIPQSITSKSLVAVVFSK